MEEIKRLRLQVDDLTIVLNRVEKEAQQKFIQDHMLELEVIHTELHEWITETWESIPNENMVEFLMDRCKTMDRLNEIEDMRQELFPVGIDAYSEKLRMDNYDLRDEISDALRKIDQIILDVVHRGKRRQT